MRIRVLEGTTLTGPGRIFKTIGRSTSSYWESFGRGVINEAALISLLFVKEATEKRGLSWDA